MTYKQNKSICTCVAYSITSYEQTPFRNAMSFRVVVAVVVFFFLIKENLFKMQCNTMASSHFLYYNSLHIDNIVHSYFACISTLQVRQKTCDLHVHTWLCYHKLLDLVDTVKIELGHSKYFFFFKLGFSLFQKNYWNIFKSNISIILWYFPVTFLGIPFF